MAHITKPFTSRIRYAPEVASKPDRLAKDLQQARWLSSRLQEEYRGLRTVRVEQKKQSSGDDSEEKNEEQPDIVMTDAADDEDDDHIDPKEIGSDVIVRRVEKIMADMRDRGLVDANDEKAVAEKKVGSCYDNSALY